MLQIYIKIMHSETERSCYNFQYDQPLEIFQLHSYIKQILDTIYKGYDEWKNIEYYHKETDSKFNTINIEDITDMPLAIETARKILSEIPFEGERFVENTHLGFCTDCVKKIQKAESNHEH